jgi:hypothetical protein
MMADHPLSQSDQASLAEDFEKVGMNKLGAGTHERLHGWMDRLYAEVFKK